MKKFEGLGRSLSKTEQKMIMGGDETIGGGGVGCINDCDSTGRGCSSNETCETFTCTDNSTGYVCKRKD